MHIRTLAVTVAAIACAAPAAAQVRGTMEFGAFGSGASFDRDLSLRDAYGGGGRIGMFLTPRWSVEFEDAQMRAGRPNGLADVNVGLLSGRLVYSSPGRVAALLGFGAGVSTETNFLHSYGVDVLAGVRIGISDNVAFRVDGVWDWLANEDWKQYRSLRVGISLFRHPEVRTVRVAAEPAPRPMPVVQTPRQDSVSAAETRRLRARDAELSALRDSLRARPTGPTAAETARMEAVIHFPHDRSELTDSARVLLDDKVRVFRANREMRIEIVGHADSDGTDAYNRDLGTRRAEAAKAYLVRQGIEASRIVISSRGESDPIGSATGSDARAANRRAAFRITIAPNTRR